MASDVICPGVSLFFLHNHINVSRYIEPHLKIIKTSFFPMTNLITLACCECLLNFKRSSNAMIEAELERMEIFSNCKHMNTFPYIGMGLVINICHVWEHIYMYLRKGFKPNKKDRSAYAEFKTAIRFQCSVAEISPCILSS